MLIGALKRMVWGVAFALLLGGGGAAAETPPVTGRITIVDRDGRSKTQHDGVMVFLDELDAPPSPPALSSPGAIRQLRKTFVPGVLPILVGTTVDFPNDDAVYHNVFSLSRAKPFDLGLYGPGGRHEVTFDQTGLVKVYCNIHPDMVAYIVVLANPYFTMTDRDGRFTIPEAPLGKATVRTWYPRSLTHRSRHIRVTPDGIQNLDLRLDEPIQLEIREETASIEHKNKWGQEYPLTYF